MRAEHRLTPPRRAARRRPSSAAGRRARACALAALLGATACTTEPTTSAPAGARDVSFGVFYGGQIQERRELPFELDRAKQRQGFRIDFDPPLEERTEVSWEISRPARRSSPAATPSSPEGRVTELGKATLAAGQTRFEQPLHFRPGDPLGLWNIRVVVRERVLIDRPFLVYDAAARRRSNKSARLPDAGL